MTYEIDVVEVAPVAIARVVRRGRLDQIGEIVMPGLDLVWSMLPGTGARTGHNVIVYNGTDGSDVFEMEVGVEVAGAIELPPGEVAIGHTPRGRALHTQHRGSYDGLPQAFRGASRPRRAKRPFDGHRCLGGLRRLERRPAAAGHGRLHTARLAGLPDRLRRVLLDFAIDAPPAANRQESA